METNRAKLSRLENESTAPDLPVVLGGTPSV